MVWKRSVCRALATLPIWCLGSALAQPQVTSDRHLPGNIFDPSSPVQFTATVNGFAAGEGQVAISVSDYFGRQVRQTTVPVRTQAGQSTAVPLSLGALDAGYYDLLIKANVTGVDGKQAEASEKVSFGVAPLVNRSAEEVRAGGFRFGLKKWNYGKGKGGAEWSEEEAVATCTQLGLQWTRELFNQQDHLGVVEMIEKHPMNVVLKVERFPAELYDEERYGPMKEWEAKFGRGAWTLKTLPKEAPYRAWLREQIRRLPAEQNIFEIWNEAWDKMSPEDFSVLCQWVSEVILAERPQAIIGPNLLGDTSPYQFDARVIKAGGMQHMKMVALHPYGGSEDRAWLRSYRSWLREQLGRDVEIYVTEFGSHSTPEGPSRRSETEQAQRIVRQALSLYAEGVRVFMPHTMGQAERDPTYVEDWYGLMRFGHQPKPALLAYANAAHQIDGSRYVGDLWLGPGCDAMLFESAGRFTLALATRGEKKEIELEPGTPEVTLVDMVGGSKRQAVSGARLRLEVGADVLYVVGVSPDLEKAASTELRADRWPEPPKPQRSARSIPRFKSPPVVDGKLDEWSSAAQLAMVNPKVNGEDASGIAYVAWDQQHLYLALNMRDNEVLNNRPRAKLYQQDSMEVFISMEPREQGTGYAPTDRQFFITPTSGEGKAIVGEVVDREAGKVEDVKGATFSVGKGGAGWVAEVAIPWSSLSDFVAKPGARAAMELRVNDADSSHERFKIDPSDAETDPTDPTAWSYLILLD